MKICHFLFEPCTLSRLTTVHNNVTLVRADCVYAIVSIYMSSDHLPAVSLYILLHFDGMEIQQDIQGNGFSGYICIQHYVEFCI